MNWSASFLDLTWRFWTALGGGLLAAAYRRDAYRGLFVALVIHVALTMLQWLRTGQMP